MSMASRTLDSLEGTYEIVGITLILRMLSMRLSCPDVNCGKRGGARQIWKEAGRHVRKSDTWLGPLRIEIHINLLRR